MAKTGGHFERANIGSVEKHNERRQDYLESVERSGRKLYFFRNLTSNNCSWVNPVYQGKTCAEIFEDLKELYKEKVGQSPQLEDRVRINKKTGRKYTVAGWSPIREAVIPIKPETIIEDFKGIINWCQAKGWNVIRVDLHKDEGYKDEVTGKVNINYHAHMVVDCVNHHTGKTVKLDAKDMSLEGFQGVCADSLGMERGVAKKVTGVEHRTPEQFKEHKATQHILKLKSEAATMQQNIDDAREELQELSIESTTQKALGIFGQDEKSKRMRRLVMESEEKAAEQIKRAQNEKEAAIKKAKEEIQTVKQNAMKAAREEVELKVKQLERDKSLLLNDVDNLRRDNQKKRKILGEASDEMEEMIKRGEASKKKIASLQSQIEHLKQLPILQALIDIIYRVMNSVKHAFTHQEQVFIKTAIKADSQQGERDNAEILWRFAKENGARSYPHWEESTHTQLMAIADAGWEGKGKEVQQETNLHRGV